MPREHYYIYCDLKVRCFYCGIDARRDFADVETAFWAYRHFDVDHVIPRRMFDLKFLEDGLGMIFGDKTQAAQAAVVIGQFNQVPACHSCNVLLNAYPDKTHEHKVTAFFNLFSTESPISTCHRNHAGAALERIKQAVLNVWEDKRSVLIARLNEERTYYNSWYTKDKDPRMPVLGSLCSLERPGIVDDLKAALEARWQKLLSGMVV
jgi:hypothetical protein